MAGDRSSESFHETPTAETPTPGERCVKACAFVGFCSVLTEMIRKQPDELSSALIKLAEVRRRSPGGDTTAPAVPELDGKDARLRRMAAEGLLSTHFLGMQLPNQSIGGADTIDQLQRAALSNCFEGPGPDGECNTVGPGSGTTRDLIEEILFPGGTDTPPA
jgi:hypothetical protein